MAIETLSNGYQWVLNGAITAGATSLTVVSASPTPLTVPFRAILRTDGVHVDEIVTVTNVAGTTFTITRAVEKISDGTQVGVAHDNGTVIAQVATAAGIPAALSGRLISIQHILTGTTTYTPTAGTNMAFVECWGAGGGGGGCATAATNAAAAGGGGAGAYSAKWVAAAAMKASFTVAVGAKGTGGASGANPGNTGGDTTFDSPSICTAKGGAGGAADTVAAGPRVAGDGGAGGALASGVGDVKVSGQPGFAGLALAAAQSLSGAGAPGFDGTSGGQGKKSSTGAGNAAAGYAAGGGGACIISGGASQAGGNGADGLIRVWEFS
jgi:hypothetical protein